MAEFVGLERGDGRFHMGAAGPGLAVAGKGKRRAHFLADRLRNVLKTLVVDFENTPQELQPVLLRPYGEGRESGLGGGDCLVDILGGSYGDPGIGLLRRGVDNVEHCGLDRIDPLAVDVEFQMIVHAMLSE